MQADERIRKRSRGRPPVEDPLISRTYRVTNDEYAEIAEAADYLGLSISEFTRQTLLRRARRVNREHAD